MNAAPAPCRVTVVMTARERHALSLRAIDSVRANTAPPYRFLYLDVQSPAALRAELRSRADAGQLELRSYDEPLWPQAARRSVLDELSGDYVMFIDNDVVVEPGWLDALLRCADETGAGIVAPLYLWSDGIGRPTIHMAGGRIVAQETPEGRVLDESHHLMNADPEREVLVRRRCDFAEFHCMLVRRSLLRDPRMLDPDIRCVHEHIDTALVAGELGAEIWLEPAARVTYLAFAPYTLDDLPMLRSRWDADEGEASIAAFSRKWRVIDDARSFGGVRHFLDRHVARIDPIRPALRERPEQSTPMRRDELAQTRSDLLDLAQRQGYSGGDLRSLSDACARAQLVMNAGYRPCGRPFLNHLIGTASVLVRYGFRIDIVVAGLLHAAYTHCPPVQSGAAAAVAQIEMLLGGRDSAVERLVHDYTLRESQLAAITVDRVGDLTTHDAELLMLVAANELDMHLSGEIRYTGRTDAIGASTLEVIDAVTDRIGARGLAVGLRRCIAEAAPVAPALLTGAAASYRIGGRTPGAMPMVGELPRFLAERARAASRRG
jgi:glycosyltransferase involved in cell wall biosynthesis